MNNVEEQLKKIVANQLGRNVEELDITLSKEEQFSIRIQDAEYVNLKTLQEYADLIKTKLEK